MSAKNRKKKIKLTPVLLLLFFASAAGAVDLHELETANSKGQWNDGIEISYEILAKDPNAAAARLQGAYALFQKGYPNSALVLLKPLKPKDWKSVPQGGDRFAEIISLFQKKVPLTLLPGRLDEISFDDASPYLHDELRFAKGRRAFDRGDLESLKSNLLGVAKGSRYYTQAHYLLGAAAARLKDYATASAEFTKIFEPSVMDQSTEFWRDLGTQMTTHWGANLRIALDSQSVTDSKKVGELALLGLARDAYATHQFEQALTYYSRVPKESVSYPRAALERIWTLLALNRHEDAQRVAAELSVGDPTFESLEARTVRALVLADVGRTKEAKAEIDSFLKAYQEAKKALQNYETTQVASTLPGFLKADFAADIRLQALQDHQDELQKELTSLRSEDVGTFPAFRALAGGLEPVILEAKQGIFKITQDHVKRRRDDLETQYIQAKLISAEIDLEDRETLRKDFKDLQNDPAKQAEHDQRLAGLLQSAVSTVDEILPRVSRNRVRLEFRQSELLWELATARGIIAQTTKNKTEQQLSDDLHARSLKIAQEVVAKNPDFERRAQAMFFVGYAQIELGHLQEGGRALQSYIAAFPRDAHVPDAYRMLADAQFDDNHFAAAEALYRKILEFPDSPVVGYALYKIGWCAYNTKDFGRALLGLEKAVQWVVGNSASGQILSLKRESRHDLISLYAEVGDSRKALDYFSRFFQGETASWIGDLAVELDRIGQFEKSADLYKTLIALEPAAANNVERQASVINGQYHLHNWPNVLTETRKLVQDYKEHLVEPQPEGKPAASAEKVVRDVTLGQLYEFQKNPNPEAAPRVREQDELYLSAFEKWPTAQEPLYQHGHFLLSQEKYSEAVDVFRKHWVQFKPTLTEPVKEEALRNLVYALDKAGEIPKNGAELQKYAQEYAASYSKTKFARPIQFLRSTVFFKQGNSEAGIQESQALFDQNATDDIGKRAFKNLRVAYYDLKDWERTYHWADHQLAGKSAGMNLYVDDLKTVRMESLFQWADQTKDDVKSADLFMQAAQDPDMKKVHEKALYNAFVRYHRAGHEIAALDVAGRLEKEFPAFEHLPEISGVRAALYQEAGDYAHAYPLLDSFVRKPGKGMDAATVTKAEMNLGLISEALGKNEEAARRYEEFVKASLEKESPQVKEAKRGIARVQAQVRPINKSEPTPWARWEKLKKTRADFEKAPLPRVKDLATRIKKGGDTLERVVKEFVDTSSSKETPAYYAFESYCSLPFLYTAYSDAVLRAADEIPDLKDAERQEIRGELGKVTDPIQQKVRSIADECVSRSAESLHEGPEYHAVLARWGWQSDAALKSRADAVLSQLKQGAPWLEPVQLKASEDEILKMHLEKKGTEDSWYALARTRLDRGARALGRLTLVDGLLLYPNSGKMLNALASLTDDPALYELAGQKASSLGWENLAYFHLKSGRLTQAERALEQSNRKDLLQELIKK